MTKPLDPFDKTQGRTEQSRMCDLIIVGSGPAGLTASIYASRYRIDHLVFGRSLGGEMALSLKIENYSGFLSISGMDLAGKMKEQVEAFGAKILHEGVVDAKKGRAGFRLTAESGKVYRSKAVIVATGTERRKLGIPGEGEYLGRGVSYCAICDAPLFRDKTVAVVGGSNAAVQGALLLAKHAKKVYIVYRRKPLRADPALIKRIEEQVKKGRVKVIYETKVVEVKGDGNRVTGVVLDPVSPRNTAGETSEVGELAVDGVFIEIGGVPGTALVRSLGVGLDGKGFIRVDLGMGTNIPGLFAAGDITSSGALLQQIVTACAQGAMAASSVYKLLRKQTPPPLRG